MTTRKYQHTKHLHTKKTKTTINIHKDQYSFDFYFLNAKKIFSTIRIHTEIINNKTYYYITSDKYSEELYAHKYNVTHFLIYCMLRFYDHKYRDIINNFVKGPIAFPLSNNEIKSFNKCMYLCNFIYYIHTKQFGNIILLLLTN
jgi:hypothetical protein